MEELDRYTRQMMVEDWGEAAQDRLSAARVGIVGVGGLGSPVATYLAAAGVGTLVICDDQDVEISNLNRQVMYRTRDLGRSKTELAAEFLMALNPEVTVIPRSERLTAENGDALFGGCHLLVDCLDNWTSRFDLNRYCVKTGTPFVHGGIKAYWGQYGLIHPVQSACLACFLDPAIAKKDPLEQEPISAIGAVVGAVGSLMALTTIRYIAEIEPFDVGVIHFLDTQSMSIESLKLERKKDCSVCGEIL